MILDNDAGAMNDKTQEAFELHYSKLKGVVESLGKSPDGIYFLRWLIHGTGVLKAGFPADHARAAFTEGQRSVGLPVLQLCTAANLSDVVLHEKEKNEVF